MLLEYCDRGSLQRAIERGKLRSRGPEGGPDMVRCPSAQRRGLLSTLKAESPGSYHLFADVWPCRPWHGAVYVHMVDCLGVHDDNSFRALSPPAYRALERAVTIT